MKPRIKKIKGKWCVNKPDPMASKSERVSYLDALNFCMMLNNRK